MLTIFESWYYKEQYTGTGIRSRLFWSGFCPIYRSLKLFGG